MRRWPGILRAYSDFYPSLDSVITLNEGNTPLVSLNHSVQHLFGKLEGQNPTGSFKDRGMTYAVTDAVHKGAHGVICASTGNTSASAAAYAARAGLQCAVLIPDHAIASGKLSQALAFGADVIPIEGNFDDALRLVREYCDLHGEWQLVNSVNPVRLAGQKSASLEIIEQLDGKAPDVVVMPVGNAGNISAYYQGFVEAAKVWGSSMPRLIGVQAEGAAPLATGKPFPQPETLATAIRIGNPASRHLATQAVEQSAGRFVAVSDAAILKAQQELAMTQGLFVEPASAAPYAALPGLLADGTIHEHEVVVCIFTGNGLKDPGIVSRYAQVGSSIQPTSADLTKRLRVR